MIDSEVVPETAREVELKFENRANYQLKFTPLETAEGIMAKIRVLCSLLEIELGPIESEKISDEYYDDSKGSVRSKGCSMRRRLRGDRHLITIKRSVKYSEAEGLERLEHEVELSDVDFRRLIESPGQIAKLIKSTVQVDLLVEPGGVKEYLVVQNDRTQARLKTTSAQYLINYHSRPN